MIQEDISSVDELKSFLEELEALAPGRKETSGKGVVYRSVETEDVVDDSIIEDSLQEQLQEELFVSTDNNVPEINEFRFSERVPVAAVDCGVA
jgi:hypothetical protein